jgi:hypothetical protein
MDFFDAQDTILLYIDETDHNNQKYIGKYLPAYDF